MSGVTPKIVHRFQKLSNFRDVGGLQTVDGRRLKTGVLFRSDELSRITDQDAAKLQAFKIRLICDLRSAKESQKKQPRLGSVKSIKLVNIPLHEQAAQDGSRKKLFSFLFAKSGSEQFREFSRGYYHHIAFEQGARIREIITLLSGDESLPALFHCTAGKDRTGFLAAIIQLLVGVPYEAVMEDYLRTNDYYGERLEKLIRIMRLMTLFQVSTERLRLILMTHSEYLAEVHDNIIKRHGSVEKYLSEVCAIEQGTLQRLKNRLLA